jgi:hypothetical protein
VTADVSSLYPSIPTAEGIASVRAFLTEQHMPPSLLDTVMALLTTVLEYSVFESDHDHHTTPSRFYRQLTGTAMGTPCAVVFANIFMYMRFDRPFLARHGAHVRCYRRFIDDIFFCVTPAHTARHTNTLTDSASVTAALNHTHPTLRVTASASYTSVAFLDLDLSVGARFAASRHLDLRTHQKEMNRYLYLPPTSFHTRAAKRSFITSELQRYARNSSSPEAFQHTRVAFHARLCARGYQPRFLNPLFATVPYTYRQEWLSRPPRPPLTRAAPPVLLKVPYDLLTATLPLRSVLDNTWKKDMVKNELLTPREPVVCFTRARNLRDALCKARPAREPTQPRPPRAPSETLRAEARRGEEVG